MFLHLSFSGCAGFKKFVHCFRLNFKELERLRTFRPKPGIPLHLLSANFSHLQVYAKYPFVYSVLHGYFEEEATAHIVISRGTSNGYFYASNNPLYYLNSPAYNPLKYVVVPFRAPDAARSD